mmetsp:Transcript_53397/g.107277  ORF Transcript_53397/g.107277 Transcript_53397/m.107277 type:complete len:135 (-) Transcript_53397:425-829(-)
MPATLSSTTSLSTTESVSTRFRPKQMPPMWCRKKRLSAGTTPSKPGLRSSASTASGELPGARHSAARHAAAAAGTPAEPHQPLAVQVLDLPRRVREQLPPMAAGIQVPERLFQHATHPEDLRLPDRAIEAKGNA